MTRATFAALTGLLALSACAVQSTVGYNDRQQGLDSCTAEAPLATCATSSCVVADLFHVELGSETIGVDGDDVFFVSAPNVIGKQRFDGGPLVELVTDLDQMQRLTVDQAYVYWTEFDSRVRAVPKQGGQPFVVASPFGHPRDVAVDSEHLYTVLSEDGVVAMTPKPSGAASQLSGQPDPQEIAVDATHVYWVNRGATGMGDGQLVRAVRGDLGSAEVMLSNLDAPVRLALGDDAIYWASLTSIFRAAKEGGTVQPMADGFSEIKAIAAFGDSLYVAGQDGLARLPAGGGDVELLDKRPVSAMALGCSGVYAATWYDEVVLRYGP